jgi:hypothetical protein
VDFPNQLRALQVICHTSEWYVDREALAYVAGTAPGLLSFSDLPLGVG